MLENVHNEVIHKVAKEQFTFTQDKADEDFKPFIKFVKQDGGTLVTETRSLRKNEKANHGNELQNLKKERREYMKQRQRLRMQGHDVNMCKNVIKHISRDSHSPQRTTTKMKTRRKTSHLPSRCYKEELRN